MGWTTKGSEFDKKFSFLHVVQTGSGAHQPHIQWIPGALSPVIKRSGREADHSTPSNAEVKNTWVYTFTPPYVFMA
jgi:hypothetical protein